LQQALPVQSDPRHGPQTPTPKQPARDQAWTVGDLLRWTTERFTKAGIDDARVDAEHLLALALDCKRLDLYVQHSRALDERERGPFRDLVRRRLSREPVAYIRGSRGFHALDLDLAVDRRVLIPRPETEHLVDWLLEELPRAPKLAHFEDPPSAVELDAAISMRIEAAAAPPLAEQPPEHPAQVVSSDSSNSSDNSDNSEPIYVVDVGTGSGAIALAIKRSRPDVSVFAVDRSKEALEVASANIKRCALDIHLRHSDLLESLPPPPGGFHAIAANLPYIPSADLEGLQPEVRKFEPMLALDGGADGLDLIRRLLDHVATAGLLAAGGRIYLEIGIDQAPQVQAMLEAHDFIEISARRDYGGIDRVIAATARG